MPFNLLYCLYLTQIGLKNELNGFKNPQISANLSPVKRGRISKDIPIELLKKKGKEMKGTLNDVLMTVLSLSLRQYLVKFKNDSKTTHLNLLVPFSIRPPPRHVMDFSFDN